MDATLTHDDDSPRDEHKTVAEAVEGLRIGMLTITEGNAGMTSRPLTLARADDDRVGFLVDRNATWVSFISDGASANLAFSDPASSRYVSLTGQLRTSRDKALIEAMWSPVDNAFFEGVDDASILAVEMQVTGGEFWSGPGNRAIAGLKLAAKVAGLDVDMGSKGTVTPGG